MTSSTARRTLVSLSAALATAALAMPGSGAGLRHGGAMPTTTMGAGARTTTVTSRPTTLGPARTGQPSQSCGSATAPSTPGNAATAAGSAFNPSGTAGTVYAGQQPQNSINTASVSQYDVACARP